MTVLANLPPALGGPIYLPRTASTYLNRGPLRSKGLELGIDRAFSQEWSGYGNYWDQTDLRPTAVEPGGRVYPPSELALPPARRFNAGVSWNRRRTLGSATVNYSGKAFWGDVLDTRYASPRPTRW